MEKQNFETFDHLYLAVKAFDIYIKFRGGSAKLRTRNRVEMNHLNELFVRRMSSSGMWRGVYLV
jgi:hypothetical protein